MGRLKDASGKSVNQLQKSPLKRSSALMIFRLNAARFDRGSRHADQQYQIPESLAPLSGLINSDS